VGRATLSGARDWWCPGLTTVYGGLLVVPVVPVVPVLCPAVPMHAMQGYLWPGGTGPSAYQLALRPKFGEGKRFVDSAKYLMYRAGRYKSSSMHSRVIRREHAANASWAYRRRSIRTSGTRPVRGPRINRAPTPPTEPTSRPSTVLDVPPSAREKEAREMPVFPWSGASTNCPGEPRQLIHFKLQQQPRCWHRVDRSEALFGCTSWQSGSRSASRPFAESRLNKQLTSWLPSRHFQVATLIFSGGTARLPIVS
jgi:hypothetical protein